MILALAWLLLGLILGSCLTLIPHIRWLQRQARINQEIDRRYDERVAEYIRQKMK